MIIVFFVSYSQNYYEEEINLNGYSNNFKIRVFVLEIKLAEVGIL
jgi:hypothetical protein